MNWMLLAETKDFSNSSRGMRGVEEGGGVGGDSGMRELSLLAQALPTPTTITTTATTISTTSAGASGSVFASSSSASTSRSAEKEEEEEGLAAGLANSFGSAFTSWRTLLHDPNPQIRDTVALNGLFWFTLSGAQMTLLPLLMVSPAYSLSAYEIGGSFAFMSMISFISSQPLAYAADRYGKVPNILLGLGLLGTSMGALPHAGVVGAALGMGAGAGAGALGAAGTGMGAAGVGAAGMGAGAAGAAGAVGAVGAVAGAGAAGVVAAVGGSGALVLLPVLVPFAMGSTMMNAVPTGEHTYIVVYSYMHSIVVYTLYIALYCIYSIYMHHD